MVEGRLPKFDWRVKLFLGVWSFSMVVLLV